MAIKIMQQNKQTKLGSMKPVKVEAKVSKKEVPMKKMKISRSMPSKTKVMGSVKKTMGY